MKQFSLFSVLALSLFVPALSQAADLCYQDGLGSTYRLSIKPACKATSAKPVAVLGTVTLGFQCQGSTLVGIHGVCFGVPSESKVHLNLTSERLDHTNIASCTTIAWNLSGAGVTSSLNGSTEAILSEIDAATTFTPIACP